MKWIIRLRLGTAPEYNEINQQMVYAGADVGAIIHQKMLWFLVNVMVRIEISSVYFDKFLYKRSYTHDKQIARQSQTSPTRVWRKIIILCTQHFLKVLT